MHSYNFFIANKLIKFALPPIQEQSYKMSNEKVIFTFSEIFKHEDYNDQSKINHRIIAKLNNDNIRFQRMANDISDDFVGYCPNYKGNIIFTVNLPNIFHELSHFIEVDKDRHLIKDFGLGGKEKFYDKNLTAKNLDIYTKREERVCAIQGLIGGYGRGAKVGNTRWLDRFKEIGAIGTKSSCMFKTIEEAKDFYTNYHNEYFKTLNSKQIESEFNRRFDQILYNLKNTNSIAA